VPPSRADARPARPRFDETIHPSPRLSIVALLAPAAWVEFRAIREALGSSDSALSKQISVLEEAGYVEVRKTSGQGGRPRTLIRLSRSGRSAFDGHVAALRAIVGMERGTVRSAESAT
jgi:predicted ArsR family transcriptional regulator